MTNEYVLMPIRSAELSVGKPLPWSVYDVDGNLLLVKGYVLESGTQLSMLKDNGFQRNYSFVDSSAVAKKFIAPVVSKKSVSATAKKEDEPPQSESKTTMDQVKWLVGEVMELQPYDTPESRYSVRMVGFVKNKSVIVTAPIVDDKLVFIREGRSFVARSFFGKSAYAFSTSVAKVVHSPYPYLHLAYPAQVRLATVRKGARAKVKVIASITLGEKEKTGAATLIDMSIGGASALASYPLGEKGDQGTVIFRINVADQEHYMTLNVALRSLTASENDDGFKHGLEFIDLSVHDKLVLSAYVNQILAETGL